MVSKKLTAWFLFPNHEKRSLSFFLGISFGYCFTHAFFGSGDQSAII
jgi:hypothetical protein